ncbi:MAG: MFS transporter [Propionibacteriaceae bacterium]|jgi:UMF1 family MFS transporter|nr:MFS transporter [Propionibacteriaceae bacterium]
MPDSAAADKRPSRPDDGLSALSNKPTARRPKVLAWALWDWGTQPFYTVITTFVFSVYITTPAYFSSDPADGNGPALALSVATTIAGVIVALIAPVLGSAAERGGHLVRHMRWLTWALGCASMALVLIAPQPRFLVLGLIILGLGSIIGEIGGSFYNATIDQVASKRDVGRVSGFGWGMGYVGGIIVLLLILFLFIQPEVGLFGLTDTPSKIRASMVLCGAWILLFTIPALLVLNDRPAKTQPQQDSGGPGRLWRHLWRGDGAERLGVVGSYRHLFASIANLWRSRRDIARFMIAAAIYRDGLAAVFAFGAVIAAQSFGFSTTEIILFGAAANLLAGVVTILFGLVDDWLGPRRVILFCLAVLSIGAIIVFALHQPGYATPAQLCDDAGVCTANPDYNAALVAQGKTIFWVFGLILSCLCGPAQAASRSLLARLIPQGQVGELFGLYTTTGRVISFLSPALFGVAVALGASVSGQGSTQHWGLLAIALILAVGWLLLWRWRSPLRLEESRSSTAMNI